MNSRKPGAYPIASFTYILVRKGMKGPKAQELKKLLKWALGPGQKIALSLNYGALPKVVQQKALHLVDGIGK